MSDTEVLHLHRVLVATRLRMGGTGVLAQSQTTKGLRIATRCTSIEQFVAAFHRFCDEQSFFISTLATRPVGLETAFSVDLVDGAPALRGLGIVLDAWTTADNPFGRAGIHLGVRRLTTASERVFVQLLIEKAAGADAPVAAPPPIEAPPPPPILPALSPRIPAPRAATPPPIPILSPAAATHEVSPASRTIKATLPAIVPPRSPARVERVTSIPLGVVDAARPSSRPVEPSPPAPTATKGTSAPASLLSLIAVEAPAHIAEGITTVSPSPAPDHTRTPGSDLVLPANPLMGITDESLEGFVDCTIYEETGNFFPIEAAPGDEVAADPPAPSPIFAPNTSGRAFVAPPPEVRAAAESPPASIPPAINVASTGHPDLTASGPPPIAYVPQPTERATFAPAPVEYPLATPPFAMEAIVHAPDATADVAELAGGPALPRVSRTMRLYMLGGAAILLVVAITVVAAGRSHGAASHPQDPTRAVAPMSPVATAVIAPPRPSQARALAIETRAEPEEPEVSGVPVVGKGPCRMTVVTTPAGSTVQLDGQAVGPSPITIDGPCQRRQLGVAHARYQSASRWVAPTAGKVESVDVVLQRPTHDLMIETSPLGATISIGGRRAGTSPTMVELMGFSTVALTITKPGYAPVTKRIYSKKPSDKLFVRLVRP